MCVDGGGWGGRTSSGSGFETVASADSHLLGGNSQKMTLQIERNCSCSGEEREIESE